MKQNCTTIAVLNQKGGVGKTTTAINLSAYLAKKEKSVLLVDADPQGNATSGVGIDKTQVSAGLYDVLFGEIDARAAIKPSSIKNLHVLPANNRLASAEVDLSSAHAREFRLKEKISSLGSYEYIIIDCPPALGLLTINALTAADLVLIPVQAEYYALEGLSQLLQVMQQVKAAYNPNLELLGVVMTMFDKRTSLAEQVYAEVQKHFDDKLFTAVIPRNVRLAEAPSYGLPISEYDKWSKGARAYKKLASEVEERIHGR